MSIIRLSMKPQFTNGFVSISWYYTVISQTLQKNFLQMLNVVIDFALRKCKQSESKYLTLIEILSDIVLQTGLNCNYENLIINSWLQRLSLQRFALNLKWKSNIFRKMSNLV